MSAIRFGLQFDMRPRPLLFSLALVAGLALAAAGSRLIAQPYAFHGSLIEPAVPAPDFSLTDQTGQVFRLSEQAGKVTLLFFGYTTCPDACPAAMGQFKRVRAALGAGAQGVRFVLITVDPERDTAERLSSFLAGFDGAFTGLTGALDEMAPVWQVYGVAREVRTAGHTSAAGDSHQTGDYTIDHTTRIYIVDGNGDLRLTYPLEVTVEDLTEDLRQLLSED